jgi:histidinol-phosphatase (PHP family)
MALEKLIDYHLHTAVTVDGNMTEYEACERAIALGIREIAFTNHVMLDQAKYRITAAAFTQHWKNIQVCQSRYPELTIRLGIEMDYYPGRESEISEKIKSYEELVDRPFDLILGAIHDIRGGFFSNKVEAVGFFKDRDIIAIYREYFELATHAARSQLFDIMAHPDLIKKYTHQLTPPVPWECYADQVEAFLDVLVSSEVGIEINTKGLKLPIQEPYPSDRFLEHYLARVRGLGKEPIITIGSDAHQAQNVGYGIMQVKQSLQAHQVTHLTSFSHRKKVAFPI